MGQEGDGQVALRAGAGPAPDRRVGGGHCAMTGLVFALFFKVGKICGPERQNCRMRFQGRGLGWVGRREEKQSGRDQKFTSG